MEPTVPSIDMQENAMTEIALAMAMGFFSIMILTMICMGIPTHKKLSENQTSIALTTLLNSKEKSGNSGVMNKEDVLVVFDGEHYRDRQLNIVEPSKIAGTNRIILALTPELPLSRALQAQSPFREKRVVVTTLNPAWQAALKARIND